MESVSGDCSDAAAIGTIKLEASLGTGSEPLDLQAAIYNLEPSAGVPAAFGAKMFGQPIILVGAFLKDGRLAVKSTNTSQVASVSGLELSLWGVPHDASHDGDRGSCFEEGAEGSATCPVDGPKKPFLTLPATCAEPITATVVMDSWGDRGSYRSKGEPNTQDPTWEIADAVPRDAAGAKIPHSGCDRLGFSPEVSVVPGSDEASAPIGVSVNLDIRDEGLENPVGVMASPVERAVVRLPVGFTIESCSRERPCCMRRKRGRSREHCPRRRGWLPEAAKIGKVEISSSILGERLIEGGVYVAEQRKNLLGSRLALYIVARNVNSGLIVKLVAAVELDPVSGQMTIMVDDLPPLPISRFRMSFGQGDRAALASPDRCGDYPARVELVPWANPDGNLDQSVSLPIRRGSGGAGCLGVSSAFQPNVVAGSMNVGAGADTSFSSESSERTMNRPLPRCLPRCHQACLPICVGLRSARRSRSKRQRALAGRKPKVHALPSLHRRSGRPVVLPRYEPARRAQGQGPRHGTTDRPHHAVGRDLLPTDDTLSVTSWMSGVFGSQLTIGNTSYNKLLSVCRNPLNVLKVGGQRIFVRTGGG